MDHNPTAFPQPYERAGDGMDLLDYFAAASLYGLHGIPLDERERESVASRCYAMAESMLAERARRKESGA